MVDHWTGRRRFPVSFDDKCQAIGDNSPKFNSFLGTLARRAKILPPIKSDRREVLPSLKEDGWNNILRGFEIGKNDAEKVKGTVLQHVGKLWKDNKARLKKRIEECTTMAKKMEMYPPYMAEYVGDAHSLLGVQRRKGED